MKEKRKISVRKILQLVLTAVVATCCIIAMVSASSIEGERTLKSLPLVHIKNDRKYHFIEEQKIMNLAIYDRNVDILHTPVAKLDVLGIEQAIKADAWVADAQVFIDIDRIMHLYVTQRVPVARIFNQEGNSYYIDSTLHTMPLSDNYTYYTMVVTNAPSLGNDSASISLKKQIVQLVRKIHTDSFWNVQISQVVIDSVGMFELIPVLGNQRILFGDTSNMNEKFGNLMAFYRNVLNRIGWDKYETLDVRFKNQVVAAPSLPYKAPVDKAIASMNWITSIEKTEAQKDSLKALEAQAVAIARVNAPLKPVAKSTKQGIAKNTVVAKTPVGKVVPKAVTKTAAVAAAPAKPATKATAPTQGKTTIKNVAKQPVAKTTTAAKAKTAAQPTSKQKAAPHKNDVKAKAKSGGAKSVKKTDATKHTAAKTTSKKAVKLPAKASKKADSKKVTAKAADKNKKKNINDKNKEKGKAKYAYPEKKQ